LDEGLALSEDKIQTVFFDFYEFYRAIALLEKETGYFCYKGRKS
jgi:hypothetical protein